MSAPPPPAAPAAPNPLLKKLLDTPLAFTPADAGAVMLALMRGGSSAQAGAFLAALKLSAKDRDPAVIAAVADAMRECALHVSFPPTAPAPNLVDIVGTGGDGHDTFNVSTASAIVAAGAGCFIAKVQADTSLALLLIRFFCLGQHGNRSSSSACGSADVLEALGARIGNVTAEKVPAIVNSSRFCFLFAQVFHPSLRAIAQARKELGVKTIFNILGPLTNPARPNRMIVGVFSDSLGPILAEALRISGVERFWIVHGKLGLDEIAPTGETDVWSYDSSAPSPAVEHFVVHPTRDFGIQEHTLEEVKGGDAAFNSETMKSLLRGRLAPGNAVCDFVLLNAGALLFVSGIASDLKDGVSKALQSINDGRALKALEAFVEASQ
ncbi:anthranilate phosphoribosyltransferase [Entophlyctis luteolus]|nr:anthranilate phosphoribosyltransferase [Entophlyctis luteolus]